MEMQNKTASIRFLRARPGKSGERGATILEFAIALVLTFVLIFGMIDFARALYSYHFLSNAAREGARYASVRGASCDPAAVTPCFAQPSDIQAFVQQIAPQGIDKASVTINQNGSFLYPNPNNLPICGYDAKLSRVYGSGTSKLPVQLHFPRELLQLQSRFVSGGHDQHEQHVSNDHLAVSKFPRSLRRGRSL